MQGWLLLVLQVVTRVFKRVTFLTKLLNFYDAWLVCKVESEFVGRVPHGE